MDPKAGCGVAGEPTLRRALGPVAATSIIVGGIIGSGIFISPAIVARNVGTPGLSLLVWVAAGLVATCGALSFAELAAAIPETGGPYVFLRRAYRSPLLGFLFGWAMFFASCTGAIAAVATAFAEYAGYWFETAGRYGPGAKRAVAAGLILFLAVVNYVSVRMAGGIQTVATLLKVAALAGIIGAGLLLGQPGLAQLQPVLPDPAQAGLLAAFGTALIPAFFAYTGWTYSAYLGGEIREPQRVLPLSILLGVGLVMVLYLLVNLAFLFVLPFEVLQTTTRPAAVAMEMMLGPVGGGLTAAAVMISTFGAANAVMLACTRTYFAMSKDRLFFRALERVHPRYRTPANAIAVQAMLAVMFVLSGSFEQILTYYAFVDFLFFVLAVLGVMLLRRVEPDLPRPHRAWGYPWTPLVFVGVGTWYLVNTMVQRPYESAVGVGLTLAGIPFYVFWSRRNRRADVVTAD